MNDDHDMTRHLPNAEAMPADFEQTEALPTLVGGVSEQASAVTQALPVEPTQTLPVAETEAMPVEKVAVPQTETKSLPVDSASTEKLSAEPLAAGAVSDESAAPVDDGQTETEPAADASAKKDVDGLKVLVLCAGAGTSAMLANAIKEGAAQTGENIASSAGAYGQHTAIMDQYDVIVLAPQVRSYYNDMKADTDRLGIKLLAPRGKEYIDLTRDPAGAIKWLRENLD